MIRTASFAALAATALALALPAHAVYKVVGPDGKVTYTDTPPPAGSNAKVQPMAVGGAGAPSLAGLPAELQQVAGRFPVTLYASANCRPCDNGRRLLQQRGVPFAEKQVGANAADNTALRSLTGNGELPVLTIGQQQIKGLQPSEWHSYLDAAGYPKESKLPASYRAPAATPLTTPAEAPAAAEPAPSAEPAPARPASGPNIRF
jgi:glutaredoxin